VYWCWSWLVFPHEFFNTRVSACFVSCSVEGVVCVFVGVPVCQFMSQSPLKRNCCLNRHSVVCPRTTSTWSSPSSIPSLPPPSFYRMTPSAFFLLIHEHTSMARCSFNAAVDLSLSSTSIVELFVLAVLFFGEVGCHPAASEYPSWAQLVSNPREHS